jgi:hypothetical protein
MSVMMAAATIHWLLCAVLGLLLKDLRLQLRADCTADCHQNTRGDGQLDSKVTLATGWATRSQYSHNGHRMGD